MIRVSMWELLSKAAIGEMQDEQGEAARWDEGRES